MRFSDWIEIVKPKYVYLKLTPHKSVENNNTDKIAKAIASLYKNISQRIYKEEKKYFYDCPCKVSYYIYIEKNIVEFYFIVPSIHMHLIKEKIGNCWKGITIKQVDTMPSISKKSAQYYMSYKKEDGLSLEVDKRSNLMLSSCLNIIDFLEGDDKVGIVFNFTPVSQYTWKNETDKTFKKIKDGIPVDREKMSAVYVFKIGFLLLTELLDVITDSLMSFIGDTNSNKNDFKDVLYKRFQMNEISPESKKKQNDLILKTQILVLSESENKRRSTNNAIAVCQAMKCRNGDNELVYKRLNKPKALDLNLFYYKEVSTNMISTNECHNFIALPSKALLEEHRMIEKLETQETQVPKELQSGVMCLGDNTYRGIKTKAYLTPDVEFRNIALTIIAPNRCGKSKFIANISNDAVRHGECTILFDFCGNCELSDEVVEAIKDNKKILNIDCADMENIQGFGYNEVKGAKNAFEQYRNAKAKTIQLLTLVDSINTGDKNLSAKMSRYLECAAIVVFTGDGTIKDVFATLMDYHLRESYLLKIPIEQLKNLEEYISGLQEIDEVNKSTGEIIGTRSSLVAGILDRVNKLKQNIFVEMMLKKDCDNNIDLVDEIQKSQLICLRMPEIMFGTESEKDVYCTYWITKIWLALQIRKWNIKDRTQHTKVNIVFDELYQVPHALEFLSKKLSQIPKFTAKIIISAHYLEQIESMKRQLLAADFILISGCDKNNYKELKEELYPYTVEDILNMKPFHALNLVKYNKGFARFITKLPKPLS